MKVKFNCTGDSCIVKKNRPVRRSGTLKIDKLEISDKVRGFLEKSFSSVDQVVKRGREKAYEYELKPTTDSDPRWVSELVNALYKAGFIRPASDFAYSFNLGRLYRDIFPEDDCFGYPYRMDQLSNDQYENFRHPTDMEIQTVRSVLQRYLTEREFIAIYFHYGLADGKKWSLRELGKMLGISSSEVNDALEIALIKLKNNISTDLS